MFNLIAIFLLFAGFFAILLGRQGFAQRLVSYSFLMLVVGLVFYLISVVKGVQNDRKNKKQ